MANNYTHETFTVDGQEFACMCNLTTKVLQITSVHPYDETEYHWARKKPNRSVWEVYRSGKRVCLIPNTSREKVAASLLRYDKNTRLTPSGKRRKKDNELFHENICPEILHRFF